MKEQKQSYPLIHMGTSFMLVIFVIFCMVIFSMLSLSTSQKDYNFTVKNAIRNQKYYEANARAEEQLSKIDSELRQLADSSQDIPEQIEFSVPINDSEALLVVLKTQPQEVPRYTITTWKQISTKEWAGDQRLPLLGNE